MSERAYRQRGQARLWLSRVRQLLVSSPFLENAGFARAFSELACRFFFLAERVRPPFVMRGGVIRVDKSQEDQSQTCSWVNPVEY